FFIYLGSGQPIVDEIYGYGDWFAAFFALTAAVIGITVLASSRVIGRFGAERVGRTASIAMVASAVTFLVVCLATDGTPPFWFWLASVSVFGAVTTVATPVYVAMAMTPVARIAGVASGLNGILTIGIGSLLAAAFDRLIDDTVTPMAVGFVLYSTLAFFARAWARGGSDEVVEPAA
ncbi:MAG: DHA1 family bicyclomycin/chloramphenicol resistance-like MFS transporter, partial [Candidatus Aldehydirespiratoraceae bacterium]